MPQGSLCYIVPIQGAQPDNSLPGGPPAYPSHGLPGSQPGADNSLPPPPPGAFPPPTASNPIVPIPPGTSVPPGTIYPPVWAGHPGNALPGGGHPSHGLPGEQPGVDNTLPSQPTTPDQSLPGEQPEPDNELPPSQSGGGGTLPVPRTFWMLAYCPSLGWKYVAVDPSLKPGTPLPPTAQPKG